MPTSIVCLSPDRPGPSIRISRVINQTDICDDDVDVPMWKKEKTNHATRAQASNMKRAINKSGLVFQHDRWAVALRWGTELAMERQR